MNILETYYTYAKLSQAAYIDLSPLAIGGKNPFNNGDIAKVAKDQERVPEFLAKNIFSDDASNPDAWTMLSPYYRTGWTTGHSDPTSGFAGMLLSNPTYGKVLAIAGTEPGKDWQTYYDLVRSDAGEIGFLGMAFRQAVSLFNYVQELSATKGQADVLRLTVRDVISSAPPPGVHFAAIPYGPDQSHYYWLEASHDGTGQGGLLPGDKLTVTGHSLGGHVAALAVALFPDLFTQAYTFNAPGHDPISSALGAGSTGFLALFGEYGAQPVAVDTIASRVVTLESEDAIPGDDSEIVSSTITGTPFSPETYITTEKVTHDIGHLTESLALQSLLAKLDATMTKDRAGSILAATTSQPIETYEKLLEQLTKLFTGNVIDLPRTEPSFSAINAGDFAIRNGFFEKYFALLDSSAYTKAVSTGVTVGVLSSITADLAQTGPNALAYRYALTELNPFVILGADYSIHNQSGELDLYDEATSKGELTEQYLNDRAQFLSGVIDANANDTGSGKALWTEVFTSDAIYFKDEASGISLQQQNTVTGGSSGPKYLFGGTGDDMLWGADEADHLYGGTGMDELDGGKGNDYIEGNAGSDILTGGEGQDTLLAGEGWDVLDGGEGTDTLLGGSGNDQIDGGAGNDQLDAGRGDDTLKGGDGKDKLLGGEGNDLLNGGDGDDILNGGRGDSDTYQFEGQFGVDSIDDADLAGTVTIDGKPATGGECIAPDRWYDEANKITYTRIGDDLVIQSDKNSVLIKDFKEGKFGIQLPGLKTKPPIAIQTDRTIEGDYEFLWFSTEDGPRLMRDDLDNIVLNTALPDPLHVDHLYDSTGNDKIIAGGGDDTVTAFRGGNDIIDAGDGDDAVDAGEGNDQIKATAGRDTLQGGTGNDTIEGGSGSDQLYGQDDDDQLFADTKIPTDKMFELNEQQTVVAGDGDWLEGGKGQDLLVGSASKDTMQGGRGK